MQILWARLGVRALSFAILLGSLGSAQTATVAYVAKSAGYPCCVVTDGSGHAMVVSGGTGGISITNVATAQSTMVAGLGRCAEVSAAGADAWGNLWIAGSTCIAAEINSFPGFYTVGLLAKLDPQGHPLFSIPIGGGDTNGTTTAFALALDPQGNAYVAGTTSQRDFPTTSGAFQGRSASGNYAFAAKFSGGGALVYSTVLGGKRPGSGAVDAAVDSRGVLTIGGGTGDSDFPVTAGVLQPSSACTAGGAGSFLTRLNAAGTGLVWSTFLGGSTDLPCGSYLQGLATDRAGYVVAAFGYSQATYIVKIDTTASSAIFVHGFTGIGSNTQIPIRLDDSGNIWFTDGMVSAGQFALLPGSLDLGSALLAELAADGSALLRTEALPSGSVGRDLAIGSDGIVAVSSAGSVLWLPAQPSAAPSIIGVADSAAATVSGTVAPGEFLSIYGTDLGGASVTFDGMAAPVLFDSDGQINVLVPYAAANRSTTTLQIAGREGISQKLPLLVVPVQPNVFTVLNQDGSGNSRSSPAPIGSTVSILVSGAGGLNRNVPDGSLTPDPAPQPIWGASIFASCPPSMQNPAPCPDLIYPSYAASAPGQRVNMLRVDVRIVEGFVFILPGGFRIAQGLKYSAPFPIYIGGE